MKGKKQPSQSQDPRKPKEETKAKPAKKGGGMLGFFKSLGGNAFKKKKNQMIVDNKVLMVQ